MIKVPKQLNGYPFSIPETVVWGDMDAMNHVNNARYFRYLETARIEFIRQLFPHFAKPGSNDITNGLALAEARCRFKVPLTYPDEIIIGSAVEEIGDSQFVVQHEIYSQKLDCIAAEGDARMVYYDYVEQRKAVIPDDLRKRLEAYTRS